MRAPSASVGPTRRAAVAFVAVFVAAAVAIGVLAAIDPVIALAALLALILVPAAVLRPSLTVYVLVFAIFAETVSVGGLTIGRLSAPLALIAVVSQALSIPVRLKDARLTLSLVGVYVLLAVASLGWTLSVGQSIDTLGSLAISVSYMVAFAVLVRTREDLRGLLWAIAVSSTVLAAVWITQYASGVDRRFNSVGDPNFFAAIQVVAIPLLVVLLTTERGLKRIALYLGIAVVAASVVTTLSRGGFATLVAMVGLVTLLPWRFLFPSRREKIAFITTSLVSLAILLPYAWGDLAARFQQGFNGSNVAGGRTDLWRAALHAYRQHPLTGLGYGAFKPNSLHFLSATSGVRLVTHLRPAVRAGEYIHNAFLGSLTELGPVGLAAFLGILGSVGHTLFRSARQAKALGERFIRSVSNGLLVGLIAFSISSVLLSTETSRGLWFLVGLSLALPGLLSRTPRAVAPPLQQPRAGAETGSVAAIGLGLDVHHR